MPTATPAEAAAEDSRYVVDLVTRTIDLSGEIEIAAHRAKTLQAQARAKVVSDEERRVAQIRLDTLQRKYGAIRAMVDAEIRATRLELDAVARTPAGHGRESRMVRLRARLEMLQSAR